MFGPIGTVFLQISSGTHDFAMHLRDDEEEEGGELSEGRLLVASENSIRPAVVRLSTRTGCFLKPDSALGSEATSGRILLVFTSCIMISAPDMCKYMNMNR